KTNQGTSMNSSTRWKSFADQTMITGEESTKEPCSEKQTETISSPHTKSRTTTDQPKFFT
ncbi:hypothetical protein, partial [Robertmurraya kyonggiensis]|uniref:hypothetical protein n=1 Tax=Robertmurraya kyonggiensis TaxID=1037680 RepID=UPI0019D531E9